jgi:hypothetical protein
MGWGKKLMGIIGEVVLGTPGDKVEAQGWGEIRFEIGEELRTPTYGLMRPFKLAVIAADAMFPTVHVDQLMHWPLPRRSTDRRFLATYRDVYHLARTSLLILGVSSSGHKWAVLVAVYFLGEIVQKAIATVFVWPARVIHPQRSVVVALWSYVESILAFAILYMWYQCLNVGPLSATQALYFSAVTATTVGYGEIFPKDEIGQRLVLGQLVVSALYVLIVINALLSRVGGEARQQGSGRH